MKNVSENISTPDFMRSDYQTIRESLAAFMLLIEIWHPFNEKGMQIIE